MRRSPLSYLLLAAAAFLGSGAAAPAQDFPTRPVTFVVPFPAGSGTDGIARVVAEEVRRGLGQPVTVENKAGGDGTIAARSVAGAAPDGYTILIGGNSTHSAAANLFRNLPYDPIRDLAPVGGLMKIPLLMAIRPDFPAADIRGFLARASAAEGGRKLSFGSSNTSSRAAAELFRSRAKVDLLHVPYRGSPQALTDLIGGRIDVFFVDPSAASGMVEEGTIRALGVTSGARLSRFPNVPTIAEAAGLPDYEMVAWIAAFAPAGTPAPIVDRLAREIAAALERPDVKSYLAKVGGEPFGVGPDQLRAFSTADIAKWAEIVELSGMERR